MDLNGTDFTKTLIAWYLKNKRDLPWRNTRNPYKVWLSEIILQQTRVEQGYPYYLKFLEAFPTVYDLAEATQEEVLKMWQGLGYYSRARNLHETAQHVAHNLNGVFPDNYKDLLKLKGVGDYTASAIASSCYKEPVAVVDGNVFRFLARYLGVATPTNSSAGLKEFKALGQEFLDFENADLYNQALMEFGSQHCKPQQPLCETCPFANKCYAFSKNEIKALPVKIKNIKVKRRYFHYLVFVSEKGKTVLQKRENKGIWQNLYQFPLIETEKAVNFADFIASEAFKEQTEGNRGIDLHNELPITHKLTHQHLFVHFWVVKMKQLASEAVPFSKIEKLPVPVLIQNFVNEFDCDTPEVLSA